MSDCLIRPQPVGIVPIPVGLLLLPKLEMEDPKLLQACLRGDLPPDLPAAWSFYYSARMGDFPSALQQVQHDDSEVARYNSFVLAPTASELESLRTTLPGNLLALLEAAAYTVGLTDEAPAAGTLDGELLAVILMVQAATELEREAPEPAIALLVQAVDLVRGISPLFASQLLTQLAGIYRSLPEPLGLKAPALYREAIALSEALATPEVVSDLWMQLGNACQEMARGRIHLLEEAVGAYQEVLRGPLNPEEHRELFALAHNNLGLVFLSMPMSEDAKKLRWGIAVQSFREALRLVDRENQTTLWGSVQMNLANALQYLPSSHQEGNLAAAVDLYEELITVGRKAFDPVGYAKLLSNQANALAHLGVFPAALKRLQEARKLFEWHGESELATASLELAGEIHERMGRHETPQSVPVEA